jgi:hypothetical protein
MKTFNCAVFLIAAAAALSNPAFATKKSADTNKKFTKTSKLTQMEFKQKDIEQVNPNLVFDAKLSDWDDGNYHYWNAPTWIRIYKDGTWQIYVFRLQNQESGFGGGPTRTAGVDFKIYQKYENGACAGNLLYSTSVVVANVKFRVDVNEPSTSGADSLLKNVLPEARCISTTQWWR